MNKKSKIRWCAIGTAVSLISLAGGCQQDADATKQHGEKILPDSEVRAVQNISAAQASAGALADSTLHPDHFNAAGLNSLGRQKLDQMLQGEESAQPLVVYLDFPKADATESAHQAVTDYLKGHGLPEAQIKLVDGPNPQTLHNSSNAIAGIQSLESSGQAASGGAASQGASAPPPTVPTGDSATH